MFIDMPIEPRGIAQQKGECIMKSKFGKPWIMHYEKKAIKEARLVYEIELSKHISEIDYHLCDEKGVKNPLKVSIQFFYTGRSRVWDEYKTTRPDVDNVAKLFLDCLTSAHMIEDDSQIASLTLEKRFDFKAHIKLSITEL